MSEIEGNSRYRNLKGPVGRLWAILLALIPITGILFIMNIHSYFGMVIYQEQYSALFFGLALTCIYIGIPASKRSRRDQVPWYDWLLAIISLCTGLYIVISYPQLVMQLGTIKLQSLIFGTFAVLLTLEALRRMVGWVLVIVVAVFILYSFVAPSMPGMLRGNRTLPEVLINYLYLDSNGILSFISIAATIALAFVIFGSVLISFGGGELLNEIAIHTFGRFRGGPAKTAVVASSLVGTVTGGPVTNVMLVGPVTIPLMINTGFTRIQAGAIEAIASTGGQIMPPIMGVAAFVMAEFLGIKYVEVAIAAVIPALLYYLCLFAQVDLIAARDGMSGSKVEGSGLGVLRKAWVLIVIFGILFYLLFVRGVPAAQVGVITTVLSIPLLFFLVKSEGGASIWKRILAALQDSGKTVIEVGVILAAAGIVVGVTGITGLGFNITRGLVAIGEHNVALLLILSAIVCIILGMGMPSVAAYSLVAILVGPALVDFGILPIAAHMFIFYFAIISNFTPPVALACFAAAPLAKAHPNDVGYYAMRLALIAYVIPFIFVFSPGLLFHDTWLMVVLGVVTSVVGTYALTVAVVGFLFSRINFVRRILFAIGAAALIFPVSLNSANMIINIIGAVIITILVIQEWLLFKRKSINNVEVKVN